MNIMNLSLLAIFLCAAFIVICSILHRIKIFPSTKGILCVTMLSIIGIWSHEFHPYQDISFDLLFIGMAFLILRQTSIAYKRGYF